MHIKLICLLLTRHPVNFTISLTIRSQEGQGGDLILTDSGYRIYWRTPSEMINRARLLEKKIVSLIIIFNLHTYKNDKFKSKPKGLICLHAMAPIPTSSFNCDFFTYNFLVDLWLFLFF